MSDTENIKWRLWWLMLGGSWGLLLVTITVIGAQHEADRHHDELLSACSEPTP